MQVWHDNYNQDWCDLNRINKYDVYILIKDALQKRIIKEGGFESRNLI